MIKIAIIIVNYNTIDLVKNLIRSIKKYTTLKSYKIVIVDNASNDNIKELKKDHPDIKLIKNKTNKGFANGNNLGIRSVKAKYYCLINPDVILLNDAISILKNNLEQKKKYGIAGPAIYDNKKNIHFEYYGKTNCLYEISKLFKLNWIYLLNYKKKYKQKLLKADWVTGAFFMIKKEVVDSIGYFNEDYFLYSEETDYCLRARKKDWEIIRVKDAEIIHLESKSTKKNSGFRLYHQYKSMLSFIRTFFGFGEYLFLKMFFFFDIVIKMIIRGSLEKIKFINHRQFFYYYFKLLKEFVNNEI